MAGVSHINQVSAQATPRVDDASADTVSLRPVRVVSAVFDECKIIDELGRGGGGIVYLARQPKLADRLVVLKFISRCESEHLSLARLQHPNIVPLFDVYENAPLNQRALCMPFCGSVTLSQLLNHWWGVPCGKRHGRDIIACLDAARIEHAPANTQASSTREFLLKADYVRALCWIGACLADALQYAHDRGLVHLDIKPANVLFATDGQPLLLDFHLARSALKPGDNPPFLGGTARYMAPEQARGCTAVAEDRPLDESIDVRADIYSLGLVLYEALSGQVVNPPGPPSTPLQELNRQVSRGLSDVVHKCLAEKASERYGSAGEVACDLRLHLEDKPLQGVANRSWPERWRKWRRRHPAQFVAVLLLASLVSGLLATAAMSWQTIVERRQTAEKLLAVGRRQLQDRHFPQAVDSLTEGLELSQSFGGNSHVSEALVGELRVATRANNARRLHILADQLRLASLAETADQRSLIVFDVSCRDLWEQRSFVFDMAVPLDSTAERQMRRDLLELAVCWADVRLALHVREPLEVRRRQALAMLGEVETLCGRSASTAFARARITGRPTPEAPVFTDAWDQYALGRALLADGQLNDAATCLEEALRYEPADYWSNYSFGVCCARLQRHGRAVAAFSVCIGQQPRNNDCSQRRGTSYAALADWEHARRDFVRVLQTRGNVVTVLLQLAQAEAALQQNEAARKTLQRLLAVEPNHTDAGKLLRQISSHK